MILTQLREDLAALGALVALSVLGLPEAPAIDPAGMAGHCESP
jgi:hypothetical protein